MYKIIGADGREYGPVPFETVQQWVRDRRANGATRIRLDGVEEWTTVGALPEFAAILQEAAATPQPPPVPGQPVPAVPEAGYDAGPSPLPEDIAERDYDLSLGDCLGRGWALVTGPTAGLAIGGCAVWLLVQLAISFLSGIPFIGLIFTLGSILAGGAFYGGLYAFMLRCLRGQPGGIPNLFDGFRDCFFQLFLAQIVPALLVMAAALPGGGIMGVGAYMMANHGSPAAAMALLTVGGVAILVPVLYLSIGWTLTIPLVMDKGLDFWTAMKLSRIVVGHHWWLVFGCLFVIGIVTGLGVLLCGVGIFFTLPLGFGATCALYETLTGPRTKELGVKPML